MGEKACIDSIIIRDVKCSSSTLNTFLEMIGLYINTNGLTSLKLEGFPRNSALNITDDQGDESILNFLTQ